MSIPLPITSSQISEVQRPSEQDRASDFPVPSLIGPFTYPPRALGDRDIKSVSEIEKSVMKLVEQMNTIVRNIKNKEVSFILCCDFAATQAFLSIPLAYKTLEGVEKKVNGENIGIYFNALRQIIMIQSESDLEKAIQKTKEISQDYFRNAIICELIKVAGKRDVKRFEDLLEEIEFKKETFQGAADYLKVLCAFIPQRVEANQSVGAQLDTIEEVFLDIEEKYMPENREEIIKLDLCVAKAYHESGRSDLADTMIMSIIRDLSDQYWTYSLERSLIETWAAIDPPAVWSRIALNEARGDDTRLDGDELWSLCVSSLKNINSAKQAAEKIRDSVKNFNSVCTILKREKDPDSVREEISKLKNRDMAKKENISSPDSVLEVEAELVMMQFMLLSFESLKSQEIRGVARRVLFEQYSLAEERVDVQPNLLRI